VTASPTPQELIARAIAIRPTLLARAPDTERRTYYGEDTHRDFEEAGFYRMLVPARYGGLEVDLATFLRVVTEIAAGDVSTAWCLCLASAHALHLATLFEERAQAELFGNGDFRSPAVAAPAGQAVRTVGGWEITGTWAYCSGAPYATHYMGQTFEAPTEPGGPLGQILLFVVPRSEWTMLDDWGDTLGLRGSGSHSIRMEGAHLPAHHVLQGQWLVDTDTARAPGLRIHGNPLYGGRTLSVFQSELSALAVGGVKGALEEYETLIRSRKTQRPPIIDRYRDPDYQRWFGSAIGRVASAEALLAAVSRRWAGHCRDFAESGRPFTREDDLALNVVAREALTLAWTAMQEDLFRTAGTSAARNGERMERIFRDVAMDWGHFGNVIRDWAWRELAREHLGLAQGAALKPDRPHAAVPR
jgi:3-hydroxy-9,10-secoandrosta-1,3,5(10)-triene-9,17-dione monooxygenase